MNATEKARDQAEERANEQIAAALAHLMPKWDTASLKNIVFMEGGYANLNFAFEHAGQRYVIRLPRKVQPYVDRRHEADWYARMPSSVGLKPIALDPGSGMMLSAWVYGTLLIDAWPGVTEADLVDYLVRVHGILPDCGRDYDLQQRIQEYTGEYVVLPSLAVPAQTCHNDLNPWNILVTDSGWVTLDWEFVGRNDPLFDLVGLHQGLDLPVETLPAMAHAYLSRRALQNGAPPHPGLSSRQPGKALQARLADMLQQFWLRELAWAEYQLANGNQRQEIFAQTENARAKLAQLNG